MEYLIEQTPLVLSHEDLVLVFHGCGWDTYSWWKSVKELKGDSLVVTYDNGDGGTSTKTITPRQFADMWSKLVRDLIISSSDPESLDATDGDLIMQFLVFGDVVFG